ncbi:TspO/MBR family protein [Xanthomonas fragariae]
MAKKPQWFGLPGWLVLCYLVAALGAMASIQAASFYAELARPAWAPPGWLFGPVWTVLYGMMAVSVWLVWRRGDGLVRQALAAWLLVPYLAWVSFAAALNFSVWQLNPQVLG